MNRLVAVCAAGATAMVSVTISTADAEPASTGAWSAPFEMGGVAIHSTLMRNGEVLIFQDVEGEAGVDRTSRVRVWNPATGQARDANLGYDRDIFCAGHNVLPDGRVLVSGGHDYTTGKKQDPVGVAESDVYDPTSRTWSPTPAMGQKRWYPTNVGLGNGKTLIFGGQEAPSVWANTVDSYDPATNAMTTLPASATTALNNNYPRMHLMPNGMIIKTGTARMSRYFDPQTNQWSDISPMLYGNRTQGVSVLLPGLNKVMAIGGRAGTTATETAEILDTSAAQPQWKYTTPMHFPRIHANAVTLPDGQVLVVGGGAAGKYDGPVKAAELYNPVTETWTVMESQLAGRMYHSTALLLPDGRVLSAGQDSGGYATMGEIFSPPYLFKGPRPTISGAPTSTGYGQSFSFTSPEAADISKVALIRPGSVTHTVDTEQRYVGLDFTTSGSTITASSPANGNAAPPGYYMLFAVDSQGVPSVADWVRVGGSSGPPAGDTAAPSVPANVSAASAAGRVDVSWSASTDNVGVTGYTVRRDGTVIAAVDAGTSYTDTAVTAGSTYSYTVQAFDAAGNKSAESTPVSATVPQTPPPGGGSITLRGASTGSNETTASVTVPKPAGAAAGDLLLATVDVRGVPAITPPAGWTQVQTNTAGTAIRKATFWRLAGASEPASYTWRFSKALNAVGSILAYDGVSATSPIQASSGQANAASTSIAAPALTTTSPDALVVGLFGLAKRATIAPPTNMVERSEVVTPTSVTTVAATAETADRVQARAGDTGAQVATANSGGQSVGQLVALTAAGGEEPPPGGGSITLRGAATGSNATTASVTVPKPAGAAAGDLLLATVDVRGVPAITPPAGWTQLQTNTSGTAIRKATFWRLAGASEPETYTWGFSKALNAVGTILAYDGVSATSPIQASSGQANAASTSITAPALTTTSPDALVVGLFGLAKRATIAPPTDMTERSEVVTPTTVTTAAATAETADRTQARAGDSGPQVATATSGGPNVGQLVALTPAG